ncbi:MAG: hypothetical protein ACFB00_03805 [Parvularculaceae bacterium]
MLMTQRVQLPSRIEVRLRQSAEFVDNVMEFAREDLVGFKRPIAATFAFTAPVVCIFAASLGDAMTALTLASGYFVLAIMALVVVGRTEWPRLVAQFERRSLEKRRAVADLKCGFGEASFFQPARAPRFYTYDNGALAFVDAGDFKTLFMSIDKGTADPRWALYRKGELNRRVWRWLRLPVSREIVSFATEGTKLPATGPVKHIRSIDAWEAIHTALGDPMDGAVIHRPYDEIVSIVEGLL